MLLLILLDSRKISLKIVEAFYGFPNQPSYAAGALSDVALLAWIVMLQKACAFSWRDDYRSQASTGAPCLIGCMKVVLFIGSLNRRSPVFRLN